MKQPLEYPNPNRANLILGITILLCFVFGSSFVVYGTKTGEMDKRVVKPIIQTLDNIGKAMSTYEAPQNVNYRYNYNEVNVNSSSSAEIEDNGDNGYYHDSTGQGINERVVVTYPPRPTYVWPTWPKWDTPTPNPTTTEWLRQWEEKDSQLKREFEEAKKRVCAQMPDAPGCQ